jgi:primosomal protein N'
VDISLAPFSKGVEGDLDSKNISLSPEWQSLIVFPDLRTLMNIIDEKFMSQAWVDTLLSSNTQNQKDKSWRNIKNWNTNIILATHSEIFQDYKNLKKIVIIRPNKRYYANQQDPRYKTLDVVKRLAEIRNCGLELIEN